ncbi:hypothetical protein [Streptomyces sp. NPDC006333]|uniref:hypothetical protein n=1 Tax=Streptomyces sp. NPDC006333 TaxID=3156753 RepID=UPI0033A1F463
MSEGQGADGLMAALRATESESWSCRAAAGRQLAAIAGREEVAPFLERLLLDPHDTGVTQETAEALLQRRDFVGLRIVLAALSLAEEWPTADQLDGEVFNHQSWMIADGRRDQFVQQLERRDSAYSWQEEIGRLTSAADTNKRDQRRSAPYLSERLRTARGLLTHALGAQ